MLKNFLPPEWAPQTAIMLTWPRPDGDFADHYAKVEDNFLRLAAQISQFEAVWINFHGAKSELLERLKHAGAQTSDIRIHPADSNDVWARDHGPITVLRETKPVHLDFTFNGWGGKFDAELDNLLTRRLKSTGALSAAVETIDFVLEGGAIEVDGRGTLLSTQRCLLAATRNPGLSQKDIESFLSKQLGIERVLWLERGDLIGDDTDGHIDTLARFCNETTIAYQACADSKDPHFDELRAMEQELRTFRTIDGAPYRLVPLPLPSAINDSAGRRLPAGYANFLILNGAVLVPTYGAPQDHAALAALSPCFPDRKVIGVDCQALILQYGSLHCVTMQIPAAPLN